MALAPARDRLYLPESEDRFMTQSRAVTRLEMTVFTDNVKALALYRKSGFEIEGTHRAASFRNGALADAHCRARLRPALAGGTAASAASAPESRPAG